MMKTALFAIVGMFCVAPAWASSIDVNFEVGTTLKCHSAKPDRQLYVTVGRVETHTDGLIVASVSIFNRSPKPGLPEVAHAPIDINVLAASCPAQAASIPLSPYFEDGYREWRNAKGRVFNVSVDRIYDAVVDQVAKTRQGGQGAQ